MGCFLGCFGGEKDQKRRRKRRNSRGNGSPQSQRNRAKNVHQETRIVAEVKQIVEESTPIDVVSELRNKPEAEEQNKPEAGEQPTPSPRKKVTFNSNITTYEHVSVHESTESHLEHNNSIAEKEIMEDLKTPSRSSSQSEDDDSAVSSVASYPPNHRYHNARESDDEYEEFGDSDLEDLDEEEEDDYDDYDEQVGTKEVWSESVAGSMESRTGNPSREELNQEVDSCMVNRNGFDHGNSVLNPVENINQWKAAKSKGRYSQKPQKENLTSNFESPRLSFSYDPVFKSKLDQTKNLSQELAVDASLSNWLSPEMKKASNGLETIESGKTMSEGSNSVTSFADRPILGALTVEELRQNSVTSSPRKSPSRSPDEMAIIGTVGTYWDYSSSLKDSESAASYKGIPNTTSKYREDKKVTWHSTPFETRLDRALNRVTTES